MNCEQILDFLNQQERKIADLKPSNPDYIPLHLLMSQEIQNDLDLFRKEVIPNYSYCENIKFNELINKYDLLAQRLKIVSDSLINQNEIVYLLYYNQALQAYAFKQLEDATYFLDRSLQYNPSFPNALILKLEKLLSKKLYRECLVLLHTLYYDAKMNREQEQKAIDFTAQFYHQLYSKADELVKASHAAEALELFEILEIFCLDLPSSYCNDDYYHGVLRSKAGIYESYLAIARVAKERGNVTISEHFLEYAEQYLAENKMDEGTKGRIDEEVKGRMDEGENKPEIVISNEKNVEIEPIVISKVIPEIITERKPEKLTEIKPETTIIPKTDSPAVIDCNALQKNYNRLILDAFDLIKKDQFEEAFQNFVYAKKIEANNCIKSDFRVEIMLIEMKKILTND